MTFESSRRLDRIILALTVALAADVWFLVWLAWQL